MVIFIFHSNLYNSFHLVCFHLALLTLSIGTIAKAPMAPAVVIATIIIVVIFAGVGRLALVAVHAVYFVRVVHAVHAACIRATFPIQAGMSAGFGSMEIAAIWKLHDVCTVGVSVHV